MKYFALMLLPVSFATPTLATPCGDREHALRDAKLVTWPALYRKQDSKGLADFLADRFVSMAGSGSLTTRSEEVAWVSATPWRPQDFQYTITHIDCPAPNIGVVLGTGRSVRNAKGGPVAHSYVSSNVFVYEAGRWRAALSHVSGEQTDLPGSSAEAELLELERRWNRAVVERDGKTVSDILSDDFVFVAPNGAIIGKAGLVKAASNRDYEIRPFETIAPVVRIHGSSAVITGTFYQSGRFKDAPFSGHYAYTDMYVKRGDGWFAVSAHASLVVPGELAGEHAAGAPRSAQSPARAGSF